MSITLNLGQEIAVEKAVDWFYDPFASQLFQIAGAAGTGKSVVIMEIINRLKLKPEEILPMAFTGQACSVMRLRGFKNARTIHGALYHMKYDIAKDRYGNPIYDPVFNTYKKKRVFTPISFYEFDRNIKLIVIDEAYMVSEKMRHVIMEYRVKVLVAGDPNQLPPVGSNPGFFVSGEITYLTELVRQQADSPIIYLANRVLQGYPIEPGMYGNDILVTYSDIITDDILSACPVVLTDSNRDRDVINSRVRHMYFGDRLPDFPQYGERVVCKQNNWDIVNEDGYALTNGLVGTVTVPPSYGSMDTNRTVPITFAPDIGSKQFENVRINCDYLNADYRARRDIRGVGYDIGELFEYAYSITVHSSQGSEYTHGIYMESAGMYRYDPMMRRAARYTAITRFKHQMIYVIARPTMDDNCDLIGGKYDDESY